MRVAGLLGLAWLLQSLSNLTNKVFLKYCSNEKVESGAKWRQDEIKAELDLSNSLKD